VNPAGSLAPVTQEIGETFKRRARTALAESLVLEFLAALDGREVYPAPKVIPEVGPGVLLVPWRRMGRVQVGDVFLSDHDYARVWRRDRHLLLDHLGDWSAAVVSVKLGEAIHIPTLHPKTWRVTEVGVAPIE
jgi:hypothetical protein